VSWLRCLGGKLGLKTDVDGLYLLLTGIGAVFATVATLSFALLYSFPFRVVITSASVLTAATLPATISLEEVNTFQSFSGGVSV